MAQAPRLSDVLDRLGRYIDQYAVSMRLVIGVERYFQEVISTVRPAGSGGPVSMETTSRTLVSELALVSAGEDWLGFRDVYEVDGIGVRDRSDRLRTLFVDTPSTAFAHARRIADESARYNIGAIQRNFNTPTTALFFFQRKNQDRFKFKRVAEEQIGDVLAWKLDYKENTQPTIIRTTTGKDAPVSGTIWLNPSDGRVLKTTLHIEAELRSSPALIVPQPGQDRAPTPVNPEAGNNSSTVSVTLPRQVVKSSIEITVTYRDDPRLGLLVPGEMSESYEQLEGQRTKGHATYSDFKRFETDTKVIVK